MKYLVVLLATSLLVTCATLPKGSTAYFSDKYSQSSGFGVSGGISIPLDGGMKK